jgi:alkylation response protein AidB-like acyl-CoA dehydrogenase
LINSDYSPALADSLFVLDQVLDWQQLFALPEFAHADAELATAVLSEGARFVSEVIAPLNARGDEQGSVLCDGKVVSPAGFRDAYRKFAAAGWAGLDLPEKYGGQNLPLTVQVTFAEMLNGACLSFSMLPLMLRAASWLLIEHGPRELVERIVPRLAEGSWGATICITESQAGSDVGRIRTRAVPQDDGSYRLTGTKIFISYGDHDFTEQIIHMVLARTPGAPPGTQGISLFVVPKLQFESPAPNGVAVSHVEKKMGLKASPTCVLELEKAVGYRIGAEHCGLQCMFTMVNLMRLEVSIQGPAVAGAATQKALNYAVERRQGGSADAPPLAIIEHADVRRMLFLMRSRTEAMRALIYETALNLDLARAASTDEERVHARRLAEFLLPVCKACGSETGFEVANLAVQVFGGYGYVADSGVEQLARDVRVAAIYEGSNGIQALDLVMRKVLKDAGGRFELFATRIQRDLDRCKNRRELGLVHAAVAEGLEALAQSTQYLLDCYRDDRRRDIEAAATDYLRLAGVIGGGWMWLRMAAAAGDSDAAMTRSSLARFYAQNVMSQVPSLMKNIYAGATVLDSIENDQLARW